MPDSNDFNDSNRETKTAPRLSRLSKISVILPAVAAGMLIALLAFLCVNVNFDLQQSRTDEGFWTVRDLVCCEVADADVPIGVIKQYTFTINEGLEKDTCLAFYTVHQYVEVYIRTACV